MRPIFRVSLQLIAAALLAAPASYGAIARDSGATTFPVTGTRADSTTGPITTTTFSTAQAVTFVLAVGYRDNGASIFPMTAAWNGGTPGGCAAWTKVTSSEQHTPSGELDVAYWTTTCSTTVSSASVTITPTAFDSGANNLAYMVDALRGASTVTAGTAIISSGTTVNKFQTMTGVTSGSWLYWASTADASAAYSTQTNTTKLVDFSGGANGHQSAVGVNTTGTGGSVAIGWTGTQAWFVGVPIEVTAAPSIAFRSASNAADCQLATTGFTLTLPASTASGSDLIVGISTLDTLVLPVSVTSGSSTFYQWEQHANPTNGGVTYAYVAHNISAATTVVLTLSGTTIACMTAMEYTGASSVSFAVAEADTISNTLAISKTTVDNNNIVAVIRGGVSDNLGSMTFSGATGGTLRANSWIGSGGASVAIAGTDQTKATAGSVNDSLDILDVLQWSALAIELRSAGTFSAPVTPTYVHGGTRLKMRGTGTNQ
jgi:hypothetical protein